jgi:hypothetical protein
MIRGHFGYKSRGRKIAEWLKSDGFIKSSALEAEVVVSTELDTYAKADMSNISSLPTAVQDLLKGADGTQGVDGTDGVQGIAGADGTDGVQGLIGPQGPVGPAGPVGATFSMSGTTLNITT